MSCAPARTCYARCVIPWGEAAVTCYAHTLEGRPESEWQRLDDHLRNVAQPAERFAREARPGDDTSLVSGVEGIADNLRKRKPA